MLELFQAELEDQRDTRGKRHDLGFVVLSFFLSILESTGKVSRQKIHRQMQRQHQRYQNFTGFKQDKCISYTQLGRILQDLDYVNLNQVFEHYFGCGIIEESGEWYAIDGKELRGSIDKALGSKRGENVILKVNHQTKGSELIGWYHGQKEGEKTQVHQYLSTQVKSGAKYTLDALHLSEDLLRQIHQQGGYYMIQLKGNQKYLLEDARHTSTHLQTDYEYITYDKGHGRSEKRIYEGYEFPAPMLAKRWQDTGIQTLFKVQREVRKNKTKKQSQQHAFYVSNMPLNRQEFESCCQAIRFHWSVETQNYQLDTQLGQDNLTGFQSPIQRNMAVFFNHALNWLKKANTENNLSKLREDILDDKNLICKLFNQY